jgi:hypothetical protein
LPIKSPPSKTKKSLTKEPRLNPSVVNQQNANLSSQPLTHLRLYAVKKETLTLMELL